MARSSKRPRRQGRAGNRRWMALLYGRYYLHRTRSCIQTHTHTRAHTRTCTRTRTHSHTYIYVHIRTIDMTNKLGKSVFHRMSTLKLFSLFQPMRQKLTVPEGIWDGKGAKVALGWGAGAAARGGGGGGGGGGAGGARARRT